MSNQGFDTAVYPHDDLMAAWKANSPYVFTGYYLKSPCHGDASWMGHRQALKGMGWGLAVLYVGQQAVGASRCSQNTLTDAQGRTDAQDAAVQASNDGFPDGTILFLDVEPVEVVPQEMLDYVKAWFDQLLTTSAPSYLPGVYCSRLNADALYNAIIPLYANHAGQSPSFWVAGTANFQRTSDPTDSGIGYASLWQGLLNQDESYGGFDCTIDVSVASSNNPSHT